MFFPMIIFLCWTDLEIHRIKVQPLDFQNEAVYPGREFYLNHISHISTDGKRLYLSSDQNHQAVVIDLDGNVLYTLGKEGSGPGEFNQGIAGLAVRGDTVWVLDGGWRHIHRFVRGTFQTSLRLKSRYVVHFLGANIFDFREEEVVVPCSARTKGLAMVYQEKKKPVVVGEAILSNEFLTGINDTMWRYHNGKWYCLFKFFPMINVFDHRFTLIESHQFDYVDYPAYQEVSEKDTSKRFTHFPPLFSDFQIYQDFLYVLSFSISELESTLNKIDLQQPKVTARAVFRGEGPDFANVPPPKILAFDKFAILDNGTVVLSSNSIAWSHDLWTAKVPFVTAKTVSNKPTE